MHEHAPYAFSRGMLVLTLALMGFGASAVQAAKYARLDTTFGPIVLELDEVKAPITTENFLDYVDDGFYAGTTFHRIISNFMIQGGGLLPDKKKKETKDPITNEAENGLTNDRYTIAMARTGDPHSATSQFFINVVDNARLNHTAPEGAGWGYCVFGRVVDGFDTVEKIRNTPVKGSSPVDTVLINKAERVSDEEGGKLAEAADEEWREMYEAAAERRRLAEEAAAAAANLVAEFVAQLEEDKSEAVTTDSGLMYLDLSIGDGEEAAAGKTVTLHYTGWLASNGKEFDSSVGGAPLSPFVLGTGAVIEGWDEGVAGMRVGGKRKLIIPAELAYGARRKGRSIPPNSSLVFDVELMGVE